MDDLARHGRGPLSWAPNALQENAMSSVIIGLIFIAGGLSGKLALVGTNSGVALAVVGVLLVGRGIYRIRQQRAVQQPH